MERGRRRRRRRRRKESILANRAMERSADQSRSDPAEAES
jgi:hypothetical protein